MFFFHGHTLLLLYSALFIGNCFFALGKEAFQQDTSYVKRTGQSILFKNIGKIPYYHDAGRYARLQSLDKAKEWKKLRGALWRYVSHFGIENFLYDTKLIWKLAKLTELFDGIEAAKPLYRLVLRHHHDEIDLGEIEFLYRTFNQEEIERYVPLDYYYKLVEHQRYIDTLRAPINKILHMGEAINSSYADYAPFLSVNHETLFFSSRRNEANRDLNVVENEDIFYAQALGDNYWEKSVPLQDINTDAFNEGSVCVDSTGEHLYFVRCGAPGGEGDCDIYSARLRKEGGWGFIEPLGSNVNSPGWDSHPSLSPSGDTLYFASDRVGGFGMSDIYFTYMRKDGSWSPARNMGPVMNTRNNEISPFRHPRRQVIYFSSNGQLYNFGGYDIFKSVWLGKSWSDPVNIGPLVNGGGSEHYFTIDAWFRYLYYAKSNTQSMDGQDLYSFPVPMEAHPDATTALRGVLQDVDTGLPLEGIAMVIDVEEGIAVSPKYLNDEGQFLFYLINDRNYLLVIQGDNFFRIEKLFYLSGDTNINQQTLTFSRRISLQSIEFGLSKAEVTPAMYADLNKVVDFLRDHKEYNLTISGHTDGLGDSDFNLALSEQRAKNIALYITEKGIATDRVHYKGYGDTDPIVKEETTEEDRALNRRVEFYIYRSKKE